MSKSQIIQLQERITGVSVLVNMVRQTLIPVEDQGSGEIEDAIFALQAIDTLFTELLNDCDILSRSE
ncbi:hypothetical protein [Acinetobacter indicus]|uniref:hypothetical protein n=1 Tax=Acinetobacter indicus TaxID=756892 RepID=UPI0032B3DBE0